LAVAEAIAKALRPMRSEWQEHLVEMGKKARAEIAAYRNQTA
jgi:hypothetical protein